uniref:Fucoxanthin-chlorophyll a/c light-harvesting protein n=2 Tax=Eukaryota TaxID=2759 RepID=A0A6S8JI27_9STRA|eukprot:scaffold3946_cov177-Amphora_coffeaeformis.AAC.16
MKLALIASLAASAAAFAPTTKQAATSTALKAFEDELGAQPPLGFFDPLGLVADGDQEKFDRLRGVEIKHGRICMLGVVGYLVNKAGIYLPGDISTDGTKFSDLGSGWDASFAVPVPGALQVLAFCGALELAGWKQAEGSYPGDFSASGFPVGFVGADTEEAQYDYRAKELNQGRAAQMGMLALMVHDKLGNVDDLLGWLP